MEKLQYEKALAFLRGTGNGDYTQEKIVKEFYQANNDRYKKNLLNEAYNQKKILGYKYNELFKQLDFTQEFEYKTVRKNWLSFN